MTNRFEQDQKGVEQPIRKEGDNSQGYSGTSDQLTNMSYDSGDIHGLDTNLTQNRPEGAAWKDTDRSENK